MSSPAPKRKLAAILAADVVGFSRMMGGDEARTLLNLKACRALTDESIEAHHGRVFGSAGDSVIAEFASPVDASSAAVEFQRNLRDRNTAVPPEDQMQFRVGLNLGDVIAEGDNLFGDGVNVAARLEPMAEPGGILVSGKFHEEVRRKLDLGFVGQVDENGAVTMEAIAQSTAKTVTMNLLCGLFSGQTKYLWLSAMGPITLEIELANKDACLDTSSSGSSSFTITNAMVLGSVVDVAPDLLNAYTKHLLTS